jgi:predicted transcriptional regulator
MSTQSETVTVRLSPETKAQLERLAGQTRRTKSFLAGEAIADYVERELKIVEAIQRGLEDVKAGRTVPHDVAVARLRATVDRAAKTRK